jgi:hypothetical protein
MYDFVNILQTNFGSCGTYDTRSNTHRGRVETFEGEKSLRDLGIDERIILRWRL